VHAGVERGLLPRGQGVEGGGGEGQGTLGAEEGEAHVAEAEPDVD
jgi:hypothetical protein